MVDRTKLNSNELAVLRQVVLARRPELSTLLERLGTAMLSTEEREKLRDVLADELCESGLGPGDEPNARGALIDGIIGRLMYY